MDETLKHRLALQRERASKDTTAQAIEKNRAAIAWFEQDLAEHDEFVRRKNTSNLRSTAGTKRTLEDEHTITAAKRPTPADRRTLQHHPLQDASLDDAHFRLGDDEDRAPGAAEDDDFDNLFALQTKDITSGVANNTIDQPTREDAYMADLGAGGEEEVQEEEVYQEEEVHQEEEVQGEQPQEDEDEGRIEEAVVEEKRGRGRPKGKPKKGNQKAPLLPIYVYSLENGGAWIDAEDLGFWDDGKNAMKAHIAKMIKGTKNGNIHKLFARIVDKGDQEINLPDALFACFGCSVLGSNKRDKCNITVRDASACDECVRLKRPCGQLIRDPIVPANLRMGSCRCTRNCERTFPSPSLRTG